MNQILSNAIKHWDYVAPLATYPRNKKEFEKLVSQLDELLLIVGNDERHHLMGLVDVISHFVEAYEAKHYRIPLAKGVVSEILNDKRALNLRQIKQLSERFHVSIESFIDD